MSEFTLTIETNNAAFDRCDSGKIELARLLDIVCERVLDGHIEGSLHDVNGNTVGSFAWTDD